MLSEPRSTTVLPVDRRLLRWEVIAVLAVTVLPLTDNAFRSLVRSVVTHVPTTVLKIALPGHPSLDIALWVVALVLGTAPVLLVSYLLARSGESLRDLGLNAHRLARNLGLAVLLVLGMFASAVGVRDLVRPLHLMHVSNSADPRMAGAYLIVFLVASAWTALLEEVLVCGYLLHRLEQLGWSDRKALGASTALRASYHLYGGVPLVLLTIPIGLAFGRIYQRSHRLTALVLAHGLYDFSAFSLFLLTR